MCKLQTQRNFIFHKTFSESMLYSACPCWFSFFKTFDILHGIFLLAVPFPEMGGAEEKQLLYRIRQFGEQNKKRGTILS